MLDSRTPPMVLFPTGFEGLMRHHNKKPTSLVKAMFRGNKAYLMSPLYMRDNQLEWSRKTKHKQLPKAEHAFELLAFAAYYLEKGLPRRPEYQWRQRLLLQEMALMRTVLVYWLLHHQYCKCQREFYQPQGQFLGTPLTPIEAHLAHKTPDGLIPVLTIHHKLGSVTAAWLTLTDEWDGMPITHAVTEPRLPTVVKKQEVVERMWGYLPPGLDRPRHRELASLIEIEPGNEMYPHPEHLIVGKFGKPAWLEEREEEDRVVPIRVPRDPVESPIDLMHELRHLP